MIRKTKAFFALPFFSDYRTLGVLWGVLAILAALLKGFNEWKVNNFKIYLGTFRHLCEQVSLYAYYPEEYGDHNLYGPVFALIIAPFTLVDPRILSLMLWLLAMAAVLFVAIRKLPMTKGAKIFAMWYVSNELLGAMFMSQFNIVIAALILLAFTATVKGRDCAAALFIMLGAMTKLYGILGLAFIVFSKHPWRQLLWCVLWGAVLFVLPMAFSSPQYVVGQYGEWVTTLTEKNALNADSLMQNISALGFAHRVSGMEFSDLWILVPAVLLFLLPSVRVSQYGSSGFRFATMASVLMCIILFSTGSESSGYIIALTGVAIWYVTAPWQRSRLDVALLIFVLVLSSFGHSDIVPKAVRNGFIKPYALKALPVLLVWLKLVWEMCTRNYCDGSVATRESRCA